MMHVAAYAFTWVAIATALISVAGFFTKRFQLQQRAFGCTLILLGVAMLMGERLRWFGPLSFVLLTSVGILQIWLAIKKRASV